MAKDAAGFPQLPFPQEGGKAEPQGSRLQSTCALVGKRRTVKPAAHTDIMLAQPVCQGLTVDHRTAQGKDACLQLPSLGEKLAFRVLQLFYGNLQMRVLAAEDCRRRPGKDRFDPGQQSGDPADILGTGFETFREILRHGLKSAL